MADVPRLWKAVERSQRHALLRKACPSKSDPIAQNNMRVKER